MANSDGSGTARTTGTSHDSADSTADVVRLQAEVATLRSRLDRRRDIRRWLSYALVVISSLLVLASTVAVWTYQTAFNTDRFMTTVEPVLEDPAFYTAVGNVVSDQALEALDLETRVTTRLNQLDEFISGALVDAVDIDPQVQDLLARFDRPTLAALAPPITSALEDRVVQLANRLVTSEAFTTRFPALVEQAHEASVALVRGDMAELPNVYVAEGEVRLNLIPIIRDVLSQVVDELREFLPDVQLPDLISDRVAEGRQQLGDALQAQLPPEFGQVTLMSQDALTGVQQTVHRLDQFVWVLLLVTVASIVATIAVSPARRRTIVQLGFAIVIGFVLGAVVIRRLQAAVLQEVATPDGERVVTVLLTEAMGSLRTIALLVGALAVVSAAVAYLAGRPAWVGRVTERSRRLVAASSAGSELERWVSSHFETLRIAGIVVAVAIVFVTGIDILPLLVVGALLALFLWAISTLKRRAPADAAGEVGAPSRGTDHGDGIAATPR
jgi:hypothetical protein